jgi:hypothetical protein
VLEIGAESLLYGKGESEGENARPLWTFRFFNEITSSQLVLSLIRGVTRPEERRADAIRRRERVVRQGASKIVNHRNVGWASAGFIESSPIPALFMSLNNSLNSTF